MKTVCLFLMAFAAACFVSEGEANGLFHRLFSAVDKDDFQDEKEDKEPPQVTGCPSNITKMTHMDHVRVGWPEPTATDNSGNVHVTVNRPNYRDFYVGVNNKVTYKFFDRSGNVAVCEFYIIVKRICRDANLGIPAFSCSHAASNAAKCETKLPGVGIYWKDICRKTCQNCPRD